MNAQASKPASQQQSQQQSQPDSDQISPAYKGMLYRLYISRLYVYGILILVHNVYIKETRNICMKRMASQTQTERIVTMKHELRTIMIQLNQFNKGINVYKLNKRSDI